MALLREEASVSELVNGLIWHPDNIEVHDRVLGRPVDHLDDTSKERLDGVNSDDQRPRSHTSGSAASLRHAQM